MRHRIDSETLKSMTLFEIQREMDALDQEIEYLRAHGSEDDYMVARDEYVRLAVREADLMREGK